MSTHCTISVKLADGTYRGVYCHFDGYPSHALKTLRKHYNSQELAEAVTAPGDMSSLDESCECPSGHTYDTPVKGYTIYYGRDRGETDVNARTGETYDDLMSRLGEEYNYLFEDGKWDIG